ncbi:phosphoribosylglycinamide formyltransferase [Candidatus Margulisiibacteriota bacterium]
MRKKKNEKLRIGVLVSGRGSNLQAIIDSIEGGDIPAEIAVVISNVPGVLALERAEKHGIRTAVVDSKQFENKGKYEEQVIKTLKDETVNLICLAGYMKLLSPEFIEEYKGRIMNIHPALLPAFTGLHVQEKALEYGVKFSGATVHFVDEGCDTGPIILQAVVPVLDDDTEETLAARILEQEHKLYPQAVKLYAEGKLKMKGRRIIIAKN